MWEIIPNPGKMRIYTSGCPKNQNKCWYRIGSPPPAGSKKVVFMSKNCPRTCVPWKLGTQAAPCTQLQPNWMIPPEVSSLAPGETLGSPKGIYCAKWRVLEQGSGLQAVPRH